MNKLFNKEILVIGTGSSIMNYAGKINTNIPILAWGDSCYFLKKNGITPQFYSFMDPFTSAAYLESSASQGVTVCVFHPIYTSSYETMLTYIGTPDGKKKNLGKFNTYKQAIRKHKPLLIPSTTIQKLKQDKDKNVDKLDGEKAALRFKDQVIIGSNPVSSGAKFKQRYMDLEENRLTMAILPLVHFLGFRTIYLLGFDGKGARFHKKHDVLKTSHKNSYAKYLERWKNWQKYHGMIIYSVTNPKWCILNKYIEYKDIFGV